MLFYFNLLMLRVVNTSGPSRTPLTAIFTVVKKVYWFFKKSDWVGVGGGFVLPPFKIFLKTRNLGFKALRIKIMEQIFYKLL